MRKIKSALGQELKLFAAQLLLAAMSQMVFQVEGLAAYYVANGSSSLHITFMRIGICYKLVAYRRTVSQVVLLKPSYHFVAYRYLF